MGEMIQYGYLVAANCKRGPLLFNKNEHIMAYALVQYGEFAEDELERIERYLKPGMVAIDVGANIGTHATAFAQMVGDKGLVYAIEPHPCNFNILCGNIAFRATQLVFPIRAMVGDKDATHRLPLVDANHPANFGALHAIGIEATGLGIETQEMRIDSMGLNRCDLIKIDVEGDEDKVILGATETIRKFSPVILAECLDLVDADASKAKLLPLLHVLGYKTYWLNTRLYRPNNFRGSTEVQEGHDRNVLAVRNPIPELTEGLQET